MGRSLNPIIKRELENLDKDDANSRQEAMTALKSFVRDLDSKTIPLFLAEVSRNKEAGSLSGECSISLYEVLARVHGVKIVPFIDNIMDSIIKTLASSASSFSVQQACSKVVPAIARYGIDASVPEESKRRIIHSLCNPLLSSLLSSQESLGAGAALCLKALVGNDNWRFASFEMVNKVCQNVAGALEESCTQSNAHMGLVMALAKRNAVALEPYARLLIQSGIRILDGRTENVNSQKRLSSIQMINFLMKSLDYWSICSEIQPIINEMEKCQTDPMAFVKGAALEALQTVRRIAEEKGTKFENGPGSVTGSNFSRRFLSGTGDLSPASASPLSRTFNSLVEHDSLIGSPILSTQDIQYLENDCRSVDRKLWDYENGLAVDVSLKDGVFSEIARSNGVSNTVFEQSHDVEFVGFSQTKPRRGGVSRSATSSPIRSRVPSRVDDDIFSTPRSHTNSLQDKRSQASSERPPRWSHRNHFLDDLDRNYLSSNAYKQRDNKIYYTDVEVFQGGGSNGSASSSMEDIHTVGGGNFKEPRGETILEKKKKSVVQGLAVKLVCGLSIALLAVVTPIAWFTSQDKGCYLVPT